MKKGLIFATTLAMALGVGVAVGAHQGKAAKVEAADSVVYLKPNIWATSNPRYEVYYWGSSSGWITLTEVATDNGVYKATLPNGASGFSFVRCDPSKAEHSWDSKWNQTVDLTFSSATPCYKVTAWGSDKSTGEWEEYSEPAAVSVYKYSLNGAAGVEMVAHQGSEVKSAELNFKKGDELTFTKDDAAFAVEPKEDGEYSKLYKSGNKLVFAQAYSGSVYLDTAGAVLWGGKFEAGYYLAGVGGEWNTKLALPAHLEEKENPEAYVVEGVEIAKDAEVKMISYPDNKDPISWYNADSSKVYTDTDVDYTVITEEGESYGNIKFNKAGVYDIYYNPTSGWYSLVDTEWTAPVYKMQIGDKEPVTLIVNEENHDEYMTAADFSFKAGEQVKFYKNDAVIAADLKEDNQYTKLFVASAEEHVLEFAEAFEGKPVINVKTNKVWAGQFTAGVYLAGLSGQWNPKLAMPATSGPNEEGAYYFGGINFTANTEIKSVTFPNDNSALSWANADAEKVHADEGITYTVITEGEGVGNLKVTSAGKYGVYYNPTSGWYSLVDEEEHVYTVKVGETSYNLVPNNANEYKLDVEGDKIDLVHGTAVAVYKDGNLDQTFTAKEIGNNNLKDGKVLATSEGQIYVDMDAKTLFVGGLPFGGYHLLKSDAVITMTHIDDFEGYIQYMAASVTFSVGDTVKFIDTNGGGEEHEYKNPAVVWPIGIVNPAGLGDHFEVVKNELQEVQYIRCIEACSTSVYMKIKSGLDEVYFGSVPEYIEQAIKFASDFENAMAESCSAPAGLKQSAVETAWAEAAADFAELSEDAQKELKLGNLSSQLEVREFGARYAGIYEQHAAHWELDDFLDWKIEPNPRYYDYALETANNSTMIIIISIAAASALAFTTLLVIKKRKQK